MDFAERANFEKNSVSPFGIAMRIKDHDITKIPFQRVPYHQDWMKEGVNIYSAKNPKTHLKEPSIFIVYPEIGSEKPEILSDLKNIPDEYAFARGFYKHPNGAKKTIASTDLDLKTETIKAINEIDDLTVKNGTEHLMELCFDGNVQGKSFDLRAELPLIIYL